MSTLRDLHIVRWDESQYQDLELFCRKAAEAGIVNNQSIDSMAVNKRKDVGLFLVYIDDSIAGTSYTHRLNDYPDTFRVGTRTCVLPEFRKFKLYFPKRSLAQAIGLTAYTIKYQWDHAVSCGAKNIVWTTNNYGDIHSMKMTNHLHKIANYNKQYYRFVENKNIYNTDQAVWQLLTGDII